MASVTRVILNTCNPPAGASLNVFQKWLIITRACVFSMTLMSALIGVLLALRDGVFRWHLAALVTLGLILAHAANNVLNDLLDYRSGVDTADYFRVKYALHPIHAGLTTQGGLLAAFFLFTGLDFALMLYFVSLQGWGVAGFAVAGLLISVLYVGGTYSLKFTGLGELAVFLVWGPLMVGGTYYVMHGALPWGVAAASAPYALLVTTVIMGKHVDKAEADRAKHIRTLPVILGEARALGAIKGMIVLFYAAVLAAAAAGILPWASVLTLGSMPRAVQVWRMLSQPRPDEPPADWPIWPLWYVGWCFHLVRLAGGLFLLGLAGQIVWGLVP